ncbi:MAG: cytochrome c [Pseudomonadota bacterium]|nr:cytochrome c [Pseudomonadota bacterium]
MYTFRRMLKASTLAAFSAAVLVSTAQEQVKLGQAITEVSLAKFDLTAEPSGTGFPAGSGTAQQGRTIFENRCATCHGSKGEGNSDATVLVGGNMQSAATPLRTVGSYWPYASTVFDFIRRAMPANAPKSLTDEETYQVAAYVLYLNGLVAEDEIMNAQTLPQVRMPNAEGFIDQSHIQ